MLKIGLRSVSYNKSPLQEIHSLVFANFRRARHRPARVNFGVKRVTQLLSYNIYRTESILLSQNPYTVRFALSADGREYVLFVSNDFTQQQTKYRFTSEVANDFKHHHSEKLADEVFKIIEDDVKNHRI